MKLMRILNREAKVTLTGGLRSWCGEMQEVKFSSVYIDTYEFDENFVCLQEKTNTTRSLY